MDVGRGELTASGPGGLRAASPSDLLFRFSDSAYNSGHMGSASIPSPSAEPTSQDKATWCWKTDFYQRRVQPASWDWSLPLSQAHTAPRGFCLPDVVNAAHQARKRRPFPEPLFLPFCEPTWAHCPYVLWISSCPVGLWGSLLRCFSALGEIRWVWSRVILVASPGPTRAACLRVPRDGRPPLQRGPMQSGGPAALSL